jgi:hypothetical protein
MNDLETLDRLVAELRSFSQRLNEIRGGFLEILQQVGGIRAKGLNADRPVLAAQFEIATGLVASLKPAALELVRHASQVLEHQQIDVLERVTLRRHLAECENAITALDIMIDVSRRTLPPEWQRRRHANSA